MITTNLPRLGALLIAILVCDASGAAQLPPDFPGITVTALDTNAVAPGRVFLAVASESPGVGTYLMILENDGTPYWYAKVDAHEVYDFKVQPNVRLSYAPFIQAHSWTGGGDVVHEIRGENYGLLETVTGGNGYVAEGHDFQVLPNGHILQFGYYMSEVDVSQFLANGHPGAHISGGILQELDAYRNVVWQWRSWDHFNFADKVTSTNAVINAFHFNDIVLDIDGNLLVGTPTEVRKINRQTGEVMWTLGGPDNDFTPVGAGASVDHWGGHATYRLENGNFLMYDNGNRAGTVSSQVHEYRLDETAKTAALDWSWAPPSIIPAWHRGNAQRLPNGNTFIGWGGAASSYRIPACTEVTADKRVVFELFFNSNSVPIESYRAFRFPWPPSQKTEITEYELATGNEYSFGETGVSLEVQAGGGGYNQFTVRREPYAPVDPVFSGVAPRVRPVRVKFSESGIPSMRAMLAFDTQSFGLSQPANCTVYYRAQSGQGIFVPQETAYNPVTGELLAVLSLSSSAGDCGEVVFGFPDVVAVPFPPLLAEVENHRGVQTYEVVAPKLAEGGTIYPVNQQLPILLSWSPKGFARWYQVQIATSSSFTNPVVDVPYQTLAYYVFTNAAPGTTYHYRVKTVNEGGESSWSTGSFQATAPTLSVKVPNGGETWSPGRKYFIQWNDNLAEDVVIELYKGGAFLQNIATYASSGVFQWEPGFDLAAGSDYAIKISSATNATLFDFSDQPFRIDSGVSITVDTMPTGLTVAVDGTNYTAPAAFSWVPGSSHTLTAESPQESGDGRTRHVFSGWSDGGGQTNVITTPHSNSTFTATYTTQHLLETSVSPSGAGSISNYPAGPWCEAGQRVELTAIPSAGYRVYYWEGVDSATGNTAQVTLTAPRAIQTIFQPANFPYFVVTSHGEVAPGQLIGNIGGRNADGTRTTYVILDNTGTNALFSSTTEALSRFVTPQGFDAVASGGTFRLKDETFSVVDTITTLGPTLDTHDIELWPNGHTLLFAQEFRTIDMSQLVPGGKPNANVTGNVIQELDADKRVVFEWHTFDHIAITNTFADMTQASFDYAHINCVTIDPTDNNLLASLRTTSEIVKINRRTGQVMWRLGGKMNMFTFLGEHPENAPYYTVGQHDVHRLANGNLLYFDNGNISGGGVTPNDRNYSRMVEYQLDEVTMTANLVWEYRHIPDIQANCTGSLKRMPNGNTFIDWGCAVPGSGYIVTEVSPAGEVVFEMKHPQTGGISSISLGGGLLKQFWNSADLVRSSTYSSAKTGQTCTSAEAGVSLSISNLTGSAENALIIQRYLDAVRFPQFSGKAPQITMERVVLSGSNITSLEGSLELDLPDTSYVFDTPVIHDPAELVVYYRPTAGDGQFMVLPTTYDSSTRKLRTTSAHLGEFIFGYPDIDETPYTPVTFSPPNQTEVNQAAPVQMTWIPQGLIGSSELQVATDAAFANLVLNTNSLGSNIFALPNPSPNSQYFWRVRTVNQGGTSEWASASFKTVPPVLQITSPAGGEVWERFQRVEFQWIDNLNENIAIDIFKGGVSNRTLTASIASSGVYPWTVGLFQPFPNGSDYTVRIRSTSNPELFVFSQPFTIITNLNFAADSITAMADGRVQLELSVPGISQVSVLGSTNLLNWDLLQTVPLTNGTGVYLDEQAPKYPIRFYRLRLP